MLMELQIVDIILKQNQILYLQKNSGQGIIFTSIQITSFGNLEMCNSSGGVTLLSEDDVDSDQIDLDYPLQHETELDSNDEFIVLDELSKRKLSSEIWFKCIYEYHNSN